MRRLFAAVTGVAIALVMASRVAAQSTTELENRCHGGADAVAACSALIGKGEARGQSLASLYTLRGMAYVRAGDQGRAIADFDQAINLSPFYAPAFGNRANAHFARGNYLQALKDYNEAIRLDPNSGRTFSNRGNAYFEQDDYQMAIRDYDQSIKLDPGRAATLRNRGIAYFLLGEADRARQDFARAVSAEPADAYSLLWLHLAAADSAAGHTRLAQDAARVDLTQWPGPIVRVFLGEATVDEVRAANAAVADAGTSAMQRCEAGFYIGAHEVLEKHSDQGRELLQEAVKTCPHAFVEYHSAVATLARLH